MEGFLYDCNGTTLSVMATKEGEIVIALQKVEQNENLAISVDPDFAREMARRINLVAAIAEGQRPDFLRAYSDQTIVKVN